MTTNTIEQVQATVNEDALLDLEPLTDEDLAKVGGGGGIQMFLN
jgi:hypothetical protein